jgi:hypothetical protein
MNLISLFILAVASLSLADQIPLDHLKTIQSLPLDTRRLIAKLANFQLTRDEARILATKTGATDAIIELTEVVQEFEHLAFVFYVLRMRSDLTDELT